MNLSCEDFLAMTDIKPLLFWKAITYNTPGCWPWQWKKNLNDCHSLWRCSWDEFDFKPCLVYSTISGKLQLTPLGAWPWIQTGWRLKRWGDLNWQHRMIPLAFPRTWAVSIRYHLPSSYRIETKETKTKKHHRQSNRDEKNHNVSKIQATRAVLACCTE